MTNQELFDIVVAHARKQNCRATSDAICKYRTPEGLKCFAGALIKDEFYDKGLEGLSAQFTATQNALMNSGIRRQQLGLVWRLQRVHDRHAVSEWPREFRDIAQDEGLVYEDAPA
jgi:hypothetical protein